MKRFATFLLLAAFAAAQTPPETGMASTAGRDFRLPLFDPSGKLRTHLLLGSSARYVVRDIELTNMHLTIFALTPENPIDTIILSPRATFSEAGRQVQGKEKVRLLRVREDLEASGDIWSYKEGEKQEGKPEDKWISMSGNVRVIFSGPLKGPSWLTAAAPGKTTIESDSLEMQVVGRETRAVLAGSVRLVGPDLGLTCEKLEIVAEGIDVDAKDAAPRAANFVSLIATGNVRIVQGGREATTGRAEVRPREDKYVLTGNPEVIDKARGLSQKGSTITLWLLRNERRVSVEDPISEGPSIKERSFDTTSPTATTRTTASAGASAGAPAAEKTVITAKHLEEVTIGNVTRAAYTGIVRLNATDLRLSADKLDVVAEDIENRNSTAPVLTKFTSLLATGGVRIAQGTREAAAGKIEVLPREDKLILTENPDLADKTTGARQKGSRITMFGWTDGGQKWRDEGRLSVDNPVADGPPIKDLGFGIEASLPDFLKASTARTLTAPEASAIEADHLELEKVGTKVTAVYTGSVRLTGTNLRLTCDRLEIVGEDTDAVGSTPKISNFVSLLATGRVRVVQSEREATGSRAEGLPREGKFSLTGNPDVLDKATGAHHKGSSMVWDNGKFTVENLDMVVPVPKDLSSEKKASETALPSPRKL